MCDHWDQPDDGIWETRGGRQDFTYGRLMSWVALDRAIRLATDRARPADLARWTTVRDMIYRQIMDRGWNSEREAFVQHYRTDVLDASLLTCRSSASSRRATRCGSRRCGRWTTSSCRTASSIATTRRRRRTVCADRRARSRSARSGTSTRWRASGRLDDARLTFEKMLTYANHLGLYSEEIGPTGEQIGNFPQAFSHLALISAAVNLDYQLEHGTNDVGAVLGRRETAVP